MFNTPLPAAQAENFTANPVFPQRMPEHLLEMDRGAAVSAILYLFDNGAICDRIAEDWLTFIENLHSVTA